MTKTIGVLAAAWICSACIGDAETRSDEPSTGNDVSALTGSGEGSGSAVLCTITQNTKCKFQYVPWPVNFPLCLQDPTVPQDTRNDEDGHVRPDCGFDHPAQVCDISAIWPNGKCDLVPGKQKCK